MPCSFFFFRRHCCTELVLSRIAAMSKPCTWSCSGKHRCAPKRWVSHVQGWHFCPSSHSLSLSHLTPRQADLPHSFAEARDNLHHAPGLHPRRKLRQKKNRTGIYQVPVNLSNKTTTCNQNKQTKTQKKRCTKVNTRYQERILVIRMIRTGGP